MFHVDWFELLWSTFALRIFVLLCIMHYQPKYDCLSSRLWFMRHRFWDTENLCLSSSVMVHSHKGTWQDSYDPVIISLILKKVLNWFAISQSYWGTEHRQIASLSHKQGKLMQQNLPWQHLTINIILVCKEKQSGKPSDYVLISACELFV